jgi:hypothetical protein
MQRTGAAHHFLPDYHVFSWLDDLDRPFDYRAGRFPFFDTSEARRSIRRLCVALLLPPAFVIGMNPVRVQTCCDAAFNAIRVFVCGAKPASLLGFC